MKPQQHWDSRAAANFVFGGAGSGLLALSFANPNPYQVATGIVLVCLGLAAVWLEIGRKLRALHVFFNPLTSWMTREAFCAAMLVFSGAAFLLDGHKAFLYGTSAFAAAFLYCQARILFAAKGIPAWRVPQVVPLIVFAGLAEGAALALLFGASPLPAGALVLARLWACHRYFARIGRPELQPAARTLVVASMLALGLAALSGFVPWFAAAAALLIVAPGWWLKHALVTRVSFKQAFTLPHLPVRGTR